METFVDHYEIIRDYARVNLTKLAKKHSVFLTPEQHEDMEQSIFDHMLKSGTIERYDPERGTTISTYIYGQTYWHALNEIKAYCEISSHETVIGESVMLQRELVSRDEDSSDPYITRALQYCLSKLQSEYPPTKTRDFAWLFNQLVESAQEGIELSLRDIADQKGISHQAVSNQIKALQQLAPVRQFYVTLKGDRYRAHEPLYTRIDPNYSLA